MPFSRYLQSNERDNVPEDDLDHTFSSQVHFQLPNLILNAPAIPPGGGAEALPAGLYPPSTSLSWFATPDGYSTAPPLPPPHQYHPSSSSSSSSPPSTLSSHFSLSSLASAYPSSDYPNLPLSIPSSLGLPIYSTSGFDLLTILSRVANRPYPKIYLGPVDLSCSFVVTDTRRFDSPIVYASPSFMKLTGYDEHEIVGRNCRFLQAPGGHLQPGQDRLHTSRDAVSHMRKNIIADKECQVSIINYRKDGSAFINMVSVIPLRGGVNNSPDEADDIVYHVGFQVDLTEQPKSILSKLKDGTYVVNYSDKPSFGPSPAAVAARDWRTSSLSMRGMSKDLRSLLSDPAFSASFHLSTSTHASTAIALSNNPAEPITLDPYDGNKPLHMFLLDRSPDFVHVVSLKGAFLYVAPAVRHVLGYDPDELVGRSLTDFCHEADCVPLMRELKEASATPGPSLLASSSSSASAAAAAPSTSSSGSTFAASAAPDGPLPSSPVSAVSVSATGGPIPRPVDLLFRMLAKGRGYVWVECRGRLHIEPGKGRKAIILSGRLRNMPYLEWGPIAKAGGLVPPLGRTRTASLPLVHSAPDDERGDAPEREREREFWGLLSSNATFLYVGAAVRDVLGWGAGEVIGKPLADFVSGNSAQEVHMAIDVELTKVLADAGGSDSSGLACDIRLKDSPSAAVPVHIVFYRSRPPQTGSIETLGNGGDPAAQAPVVCQVKLLADGSSPPPSQPIIHSLRDSVFDETEINRKSSWQFELQQLKFSNQRLIEEAIFLEASLAKKRQRKQQRLSSTSAAPSSGAVIGGHGRLTGSTAAGPRMTISYAPPPPPLPSAGMQAQAPSLASPLNVRFVSTSQGIPRAAAPASSSRSHHAPGAAAAAATASGSTAISQSCSSPHTSVLLPPLPTSQVMSHGHPPPAISQMSRGAGQQHHLPPLTSPTTPQGYEHQQRLGDSAMYGPSRMRRSTESSLQDWGAYFEQADPGGGGTAAGGGGGLPSVYGAMPTKRSWDQSLRDPNSAGA